MKKIKFTYQPPTSGQHRVYVIGTFNNWNQVQNLMIESNGFYTCNIELEDGKYYYQFVIDGNIRNDLNQDLKEFKGKLVSYLSVNSKESFIALYNFKVALDQGIKVVSVVGDFNNWLPDANRLVKGSNNLFQTSLFLENGEYGYKYLGDKGYWFTEKTQKNHDKNSDKLHVDNARIAIDDSVDNIIDKGLLSNITSDTLTFSEELISITRYETNLYEFKVKNPLKTFDSISLIINNEQFIPVKCGTIDDFTGFVVELKIDNVIDIKKIKYAVDIEGTTCYILNNCITLKDNLFDVINLDTIDIYPIPKALTDAVMYQILPDRFNNSDSTINPLFKEKYYLNQNKAPKKERTLEKNQAYYHLSNWNELELLKDNIYSKDKNPDWFAFFGGDLQGIKEKIDYLLDIGVNLIYLNPVFKAKSYHRYDTIDFQLIDPHIGSNEQFKELVSLLHSNGIKVILDIALNHCGVDFFAFEDCIKNGKESEYWNWYDWYKWPLPNNIDKDFVAEDYYSCWWGVKDLPDFNYDLAKESPEENKIHDYQQAEVNVELVSYLLESISMWTRDFNIDGFRLDVPEEVPFWFWKLFYNKMKSLNSEIYLVGEVWSDTKVWFSNMYIDSVMNYHSFRDPVVEYFILKNIPKNEFINRVAQALVGKPERILKLQMNLLGSHDTQRIRSLAKDNMDALKLAILFQFTFKGIPHIYYGDEIFMDGTTDPDNRRPFDWEYESNKSSVAILNFYRKMIEFRKKYISHFQGIINFIKDPYIICYECISSEYDYRIKVMINTTEKSVSLDSKNIIESNILLTTSDTEQLNPNQYIIIKIN